MDIELVEKKASLAMSLGLPHIYKDLNNKIETERKMKEIRGLTDMKFKKTTEADISKKLNCPRTEFNISLGFQDMMNDSDAKGLYIAPFMITILVMLSSALWGSEAHHIRSTMLWAFSHISIWSWLIPVIGLFLYSISNIDVSHDILENWRFQLPFGALLAVKECKDRGISNEFRIYYPAKTSTFVRADDPVIVAVLPDASLLEVFAWDDGKTYEEDVVISRTGTTRSVKVRKSRYKTLGGVK